MHWEFVLQTAVNAVNHYTLPDKLTVDNSIQQDSSNSGLGRYRVHYEFELLIRINQFSAGVLMYSRSRQ